MTRGPYDDLPDVRDGLNRLERAVMYVMHQMEKEKPDRNVPTLQLYGRVIELVGCSKEEFQAVLNRMVNRPISGDPGL